MAFGGGGGVILCGVQSFLSPRMGLNFRHLSSCDTIAFWPSAQHTWVQVSAVAWHLHAILSAYLSFLCTVLALHIHTKLDRYLWMPRTLHG